MAFQRAIFYVNRCSGSVFDWVVFSRRDFFISRILDFSIDFDRNIETRKFRFPLFLPLLLACPACVIMPSDTDEEDTEDFEPSDGPPLTEGTLVYLDSTGTAGIITKINFEKDEVTIMLLSCNTYSDSQSSHLYRPLVTVPINRVCTVVEQIRKEQALLQSTRTCTTAAPATASSTTTHRKRHDDLGLRYPPLRFTSQAISAYRWTQSSLTIWPKISGDSRRWRNDTKLSSGEELLHLVFEEEEIEDDPFGDDCTASNRIFNTFVAFVVGNVVDLDPNFDDVEYEQNLKEYVSNLNTFQSLSCCCIELRHTVESSLGLWLSVYETIAESEFPHEVMVARSQQHSPKTLVLAYLVRSPTCTGVGCSTATNFIHAFNLKMYCSDCFNAAQQQQELALTNWSEAKYGLTKLCVLCIALKSPYSGQLVRVCLSSLLNPRCRIQTVHRSAVQPVAALEHIAEPGTPLPLTFKTTEQGTITSVMVDDIDGYTPLDMDQNIQTIQTRYNEERKKETRKREAALISLGKNFKIPASANKRQKQAKETNVRKAMCVLHEAGLFGVDTVVRVVQQEVSTRSSAQIGTEGTVVEFLKARAPEEIYLVDFGSSHGPTPMKRSFLQVNQEKSTCAKRVKRAQNKLTR